VGKYVIDEVHLASVATTYGGVRSGNGTIATSAGNVTIKNFVWGLCLPVGWQWPKENTCIGVAYSQFVNWCNTAGTEDAEWYNAPASGTVAE
jgi:LruC domain-containing protein